MVRTLSSGLVVFVVKRKITNFLFCKSFCSIGADDELIYIIFDYSKDKNNVYST